MLLALTSYQVALLCTAAIFIAFALTVSLVVPRSRPDFPGGRLAVFLGICVALFAAQLTAVFVLAQFGEGNGTAAEAATTTETSGTTTETTTAPTTATESTTTTSAETTTGQTTTPPTATETTTTTTAAGGQGDPAAGKAVFTGTAAGCKNCHTLKDAGATGTVGPNLDELKPTYDRVVKQVTNGGAIMPAFKGTLTQQQIQDVAAYVSSVAGR